MEFDALFEYIGEVGPYQVYLFIVLVLPLIVSGTFSTPFRIAYMDHWCQIPSLSDFPPEQQKYIAIPINENGVYDRCNVYELNFSSYRWGLKHKKTIAFVFYLNYTVYPCKTGQCTKLMTTSKSKNIIFHMPKYIWNYDWENIEVRL